MEAARKYASTHTSSLTLGDSGPQFYLLMAFFKHGICVMAVFLCSIRLNAKKPKVAFFVHYAICVLYQMMEF